MKLYRVIGTFNFRYVEDGMVYPVSCPEPPPLDEERIDRVRRLFVSLPERDFKEEAWEDITHG